MVERTKFKPIPPTTTQRNVEVQPLPYTGVGSLLHWEGRDTLSLTILNNIVDNSVISHIQSFNSTHGAWVELKKKLEFKDVVTKVFLEDKLHIIKMKDNDSVIKHIHTFKTLLK